MLLAIRAGFDGGGFNPWNGARSRANSRRSAVVAKNRVWQHAPAWDQLNQASPEPVDGQRRAKRSVAGGSAATGSSLSCAESAQLTAFSTSVPAAAPLSSGSTALHPILAVDLAPQQEVAELDKPGMSTLCRADGTQLPFRRWRVRCRVFELGHEHVPKRLQHHFAKEVRRVGARYFVQTPYRFSNVDVQRLVGRVNRTTMFFQTSSCPPPSWSE